MSVNGILKKKPGAEQIFCNNNIQNWSINSQQTGTTYATQDQFARRGDLEYIGSHLILDFWEATGLNNLQLVEKALRDSVIATNATLLHIHLHHFTPNHGITGVAVLAESHITVHTWPERGYAAFDVFMCGDARPEITIPVLKQAFKPGRISVYELLRGRVEVR